MDAARPSDGSEGEQSGPALTLRLPPALKDEVRRWLDRAASDDVVARVWARDDTLWGEAGAPEVADRLGWLTAPETSRGQLAEITRFAEEVRADGIRDAVLLGMGGSSLAPETVARSLRAAGGAPRPGATLRVLDSVDPDAVRAVEAEVELERTLFLVSTKSGGTIETLSLARYYLTLVGERLGAEVTGRHFAAITDPGSSLLELAAEHGFRRAFLGDPEIGGRFSAMSVFGTVPAALAGADVGALLAGAERARTRCGPDRAGRANEGLVLGAALGALALSGRDKLTVLVDEPLAGLGLWLEQLIAESTGKDGRGIVPVVDEPPAGLETPGPDRAFLAVGPPEGDAAALAARMEGQGHPAIVLGAGGPDDLGALFYLTEFATAVAGWALGVNPFDQPNVQESKERTKAVLEGGGGSAGADDHGEAWASVLDGAAPPEYVALMAYAPPSDELDRATARLRAAVAARTGAAVTFGYGPRFLHSTGQLHKGGPPTGRFVQLVREPPAGDVAIPGAGYGFGTLLAAQADGDLEALRSTGRPAARVILEGDPATAVERLTNEIAAA